ncbi:MAG: hypothetical protein IPN71_07140 [Fibrobacteres bacterium]|nr:hypothetical protein [Fibrobacterota bacterium]
MPFRRIDSTAPDTATSGAIQAGNAGDVPAPLRNWIWSTLRRSGELPWIDSFVSKDLSKRTRLRFSGDTWTVDFENMDVGVLGDGIDENWTDFGVRVLVAGTRLCDRPGKVRHSAWIADKLEGLERTRCSSTDDQQAARSWFAAQFGRDPTGSDLRFEPGGGVDFLRMACSRPDTLRRIGLLINVPMDTLEIEGCVLPVQEQRSLPDKLRRLSLVHAHGRAFEYSGRIEQELRIEGGDFTWVNLKSSNGIGDGASADGIAAGARFALVGLAVCRPELSKRLRACGFLVDSTRCEGYPFDLFTERDRWEEEFERTRDGRGAAKGSAGLTYEDMPVYDTAVLTKSEAVGIDDDPWSEPGPLAFTPRVIRFDKDGIDLVDGGANHRYFLRGGAIRVSVRGKRIRSGMTRAQLISIVGSPSLDKGEFLAWRSYLECDQEPFSIQARFDAEGKLIGWYDRSQPMCGC